MVKYGHSNRFNYSSGQIKLGNNTFSNTSVGYQINALNLAHSQFNRNHKRPAVDKVINPPSILSGNGESVYIYRNTAGWAMLNSIDGYSPGGTVPYCPSTQKPPKITINPKICVPNSDLFQNCYTLNCTGSCCDSIGTGYYKIQCTGSGIDGRYEYKDSIGLSVYLATNNTNQGFGEGWQTCPNQVINKWSYSGHATTTCGNIDYNPTSLCNN